VPDEPVPDEPVPDGPVPGAEEIAAQLEDLGEQLAELALGWLHRAVREAGATGPASGELAWERRLTRARRAVERAAALLRGAAED